jgi:rod shape-determining protein MreC
MYGLPLTNMPPVGGAIYTTGIGGVFPPGLFIGTIEGTRAEDADVERYASVNVRPAVDFSRVQEVFVVKGSERADVWSDGEGSFQRPEIQ